MKRVAFAVVAGALLLAPGAKAEWVDVSKGLPESEIQSVAVSGKAEPVLYAASLKRLYRFDAPQQQWKQVLSARGKNQIRHIHVDSRDENTVYTASDRGVQKSEHSGQKWQWIYRGSGENEATVHFIAQDPSDPEILWLATAGGLVKINKNGKASEKIPGFTHMQVYSLEIENTPEKRMLATTENGVYKSGDKGLSWQKVLAKREQAPEENGSQALSQFQIEELVSGGNHFSNLVHSASQNNYWAAASDKIYRSDAGGESWDSVPAALPGKQLRYLAASPESVYAATENGVYRWESSVNSFKDVSEGLPSKDIRMIVYHEYSGDLYAATRKGIHRFPKPDFIPAQPERPVETNEILGRFEQEPRIAEIQQAAIRYAEVHPEKIEAWRRAAARKAMFPTLSLGADRGENQNVDIDRGGTGDPDRFILGPEEKAMDWHVDLSWDLGELVWNQDQTSIDTRSKLMVELRDDIINEVTHLYFERRRLQADLLLTPPESLPLRIEKELKLQELTASVDALTGGYLSQNLPEADHAIRG